jgi:hypothetical protein
MVIVKKNYLATWAIPISKKYFGANKTWRGIIFVSFVNGLLTLVPGMVLKKDLLYFFLLGFILGLAYVLAELPNSYLKRLLQIPPGGRHPTYPFLFLCIDKADSVAGVLFVYFLLSDITLLTCLYLFMISVTVHFAISFLLVKLKIKASI